MPLIQPSPPRRTALLAALTLAMTGCATTSTPDQPDRQPGCATRVEHVLSTWPTRLV